MINGHKVHLKVLKKKGMTSKNYARLWKSPKQTFRYFEAARQRAFVSAP